MFSFKYRINSYPFQYEKKFNYVREYSSFCLIFFFQMVEMVCLHVISLMEALQECNSTIFVKVCCYYISTWLLENYLNIESNTIIFNSYS